MTNYDHELRNLIEQSHFVYRPVTKDDIDCISDNWTVLANVLTPGTSFSQGIVRRSQQDIYAILRNHLSPVFNCTAGLVTPVVTKSGQ
jgi:hypothetical protein